MVRDEETPEIPQPIPCSACRGTGQVISNLGGSPSTITCPWCEGTSTVIPEHDAQARWRQEQPAEPGDQPAGPGGASGDGPAAA